MTTLARHAPTRPTIPVRLADMLRSASEIWAWAQQDRHARVFVGMVRLGLNLATCGYFEVRRNGPHLGPVIR